jgi:competence protein ComGC
MSRNNGFTRIDLLAVLFTLALVSIVVVPRFNQSIQTAKQEQCLRNLQVLEGAITTWELQEAISNKASITAAAIAPYSKATTQIYCPAGGVYSLGHIGDTYPVYCSLPTHEAALEQK